MITVRDLTVRFEAKTVFDHASFDLPEEGVVMLYGVSGKGKTTLLRVLAGLLRPDSGTVSGLSGRTVSFAFQEPRLLDWRTAEDNIALVSSREKAISLLETLGLSEERNALAKTLSGGQKQRVSLARAFAYSDNVVLLDEPFTGLDEENRFKAAALIRSAKLAIVVSHDEDDAALLDATKKIML
ncbi:MAG: ATP-binding cassette domain-containing protein [Clostridia bacterium]|nr:ATP-binding cassette domain-containing protein [Clostridia bacterium]